ncbi:hypothetical protein D046_2650 [Vibrio parahaemolyticus V-223/04]|nr:hypothetical protein D046_2650 [Vibrio parahaemolyticus V-223/04]
MLAFLSFYFVTKLETSGMSSLFALTTLIIKPLFKFFH